MNKGQLKKLLEEDGLNDYAEVVIEDDSADIYGVGKVEEDMGRLIISTGDIEE